MSATSPLRMPLEHSASSGMLASRSASCPIRPKSRVRDRSLAKPSFAFLADVTHKQNLHHAGASLLSKLSKMQLDVREEEVRRPLSLLRSFGPVHVLILVVVDA